MDTQLTEMQWTRGDVYPDIIADIDEYTTPAAFMRDIEANLPRENQRRGRVFELAFCEILKQESITPFYYQVRFTPRPIIDFDVLLYQSPNRPWSFSLKTSFRERWKQAYLEAVILKNTYPAARSYLVTLHENEARTRQESIKNQQTPELDGCILANTPELDSLINLLRKQRFEAIRPVRLFEGREFRK